MRRVGFGYLVGLFALVVSATPTLGQKATQEAEVFELAVLNKSCRIVLTEIADGKGGKLLEYPDDCDPVFQGLVAYRNNQQRTTVFLFAANVNTRRPMDAAVRVERAQGDIFRGSADDGMAVTLKYLGSFDPYMQPAKAAAQTTNPSCLHYADTKQCTGDSEYTAELVGEGVFVQQKLRSNLNLRLGPDATFAAVAKARSGQCLQVLSCEETAGETATWCRTNSEGRLLWFAKRIGNTVYAKNGCQ